MKLYQAIQSTVKSGFSNMSPVENRKITYVEVRKLGFFCGLGLGQARALLQTKRSTFKESAVIFRGLTCILSHQQSS